MHMYMLHLGLPELAGGHSGLCVNLWKSGAALYRPYPASSSRTHESTVKTRDFISIFFVKLSHLPLALLIVLFTCSEIENLVIVVRWLSKASTS